MGWVKLFSAGFVSVLVVLTAVSGVAYTTGSSTDADAAAQQDELTTQIQTHPSLQDQTPVVFENQRVTNGTTVSIDSAMLPEGGFVAIFNARLYEEGPISDVFKGASEYLEPGMHQNVTVELNTNSTGYYIAVPYKDTNGDEQFESDVVSPTEEPYDDSYDGPSLSVASVTFGPGDDRRNARASVSFKDQAVLGSGNNTTVVVDSVILPGGGFVSIDGMFAFGIPETQTIGTSDYLPPGTHENVTIPLSAEYGAFKADHNYIAVVHNDTDSDERYEYDQYATEVDEAYEAENGLRILDNAFIASSDETETPTETETPPATGTPQPMTDTLPTGEPTMTPSKQKTITIKSTGDERAWYQFTVIGNVTYGDTANPVQAEFPDRIDQTTSDIVEGEIVSGSVADGGKDDYIVTGPIWDFTVDGPAAVYVNGEQVDPGDLRFTPPMATPTSPSTDPSKHESPTDPQYAATRTMSPTDNLPTATPMGKTTPSRSRTATGASPRVTGTDGSGTRQTERTGIMNIAGNRVTTFGLFFLTVAIAFLFLLADSRWRN